MEGPRFIVVSKTHSCSKYFAHQVQGQNPLHLSFFSLQILHAYAALVRKADLRALLSILELTSPFPNIASEWGIMKLFVQNVPRLF
jgi:hypothetical protein